MQKAFNPRCVDFHSFLAVGAMRWYQGWFLPLSNKFGKEIVVFPYKMPCDGNYGAVWFPKDLLAGLGCFFPFSPDLISPKSPAEGRRCWAWQSSFEEMLSLTVFFFFLNPFIFPWFLEIWLKSSCSCMVQQSISFKVLLLFPRNMFILWNNAHVCMYTHSFWL